MIWVIIIVCFLAVELIYRLVRLSGERKSKNKRAKALRRLMERRVLDRTLREHISREQAYSEEAGKSFLCVEFPDTKPLLSYLFGLDTCVTVGRSKENMVCIHDSRISRLHAKIMNTQGGLMIQDMGTVNGTRVRRGVFGGMRIEPGRQAYLRSGDMIVMGNYRMRIRICYGWEAHR